MTNSSWFAGNFLILVLKVPCSQNPLSPRQTEMVDHLQEMIKSTHLLKHEFESVHCLSDQNYKFLSIISNSCPILQIIFDDISLFFNWITKHHEEKQKSFSE